MTKPRRATHAFTEEFYRFQYPGSSMGVAVAPDGTTAQGSRSVVHGRGGLECLAPCRSAHDFGVRRLPRSGQCSVAASGVRRPGGRTAANAARFGEPPQWGLDDRLAASLEPPFVASGLRLALPILLRSTGPQPQRTVLRQTEAGDDEIPCLCHGLHCAVWAPLHAGADLGPTPRSDGDRVAAVTGTPRRNRSENQAFAAGSRLLQCPGDRVSAKPTARFSDAGGDAWTAGQETRRADGFALDQTTESRLACAYAEERQTHGNRLGVRGLSHAPQPQGPQTRPAETPLRCLASERSPDRDPRALPQTLWHRIELPPDAAGADLHLHTQSALAFAVCGCSSAPPQPVGVAPRNQAGGGPRRRHDAPPGPLTFQTPARLDRGRKSTRLNSSHG